MVSFDKFLDKNNFQFEVFHLVKNFFCSDKTVLSIVSRELFLTEIFSIELFLFILEIRQNYIVFFFFKSCGENEFVQSVNFLPANIKSINPMQKYPHIIELFSCTQKMLVFIFLFPGNSLIDFLISSGIYSTPKLSK